MARKGFGFMRGVSAGLCALALCSGSTAGAERPSAPQAISSSTRLPTRISEPPQGAGKAYLADKELPANYIESEYLVSGLANIYDHDAARRLVIAKPNQPYTTRILIRRPRDRAKFSGTVIFDLMHPEAGVSTLWPGLRDYIMRSGDAYVQLTTRREARNPVLAGTPGPIERLKLGDPVRYGTINFSDGGLTWDMISQVGRLIKTDVAENPMRAFRPRSMLAGGFSGAGALTLFYINEGFANAARMPGGGPIFDGYFVGEPSWYPRVNSTVPASMDMAEFDPRQPVKPRDVPAISIYSMVFLSPFGLGRVRPDSDAPEDRYRLYVVPGASHVSVSRRGGEYGGLNPKCDYPGNLLPLERYFALTFEYLKRWSRGIAPPHAQRLELDASGSPVLDVHGNLKGGIRSTQVDVPTARHFKNTPGFLCEMVGAQEEFSSEKLRQLYGSEANYVARVAKRAHQLVSEGWLLPQYAQQAIEEAKSVKFNN